LVVLIDPSDRELFKLMKLIVDSNWDNEPEEDNLIIQLESKRRMIEIIEDENNKDNLFISFPKKKKFGIF